MGGWVLSFSLFPPSRCRARLVRASGGPPGLSSVRCVCLLPAGFAPVSGGFRLGSASSGPCSRVGGWVGLSPVFVPFRSPSPSLPTGECGQRGGRGPKRDKDRGHGTGPGRVRRKGQHGAAGNPQHPPTQGRETGATGGEQRRRTYGEGAKGGERGGQAPTFAHVAAGEAWW